MTLLLYAVMARELGEAAFGVFVFALAFVMLVTTLASFGQDGILTREVARDRGLIHRYFSTRSRSSCARAARSGPPWRSPGRSGWAPRRGS